MLPGGLGQARWGIEPQNPSSQSLWPPGTEGPVRRALRGSALPVRAAGSRLRSLKHAARGWPGASSTKALPRGGNPISTPFSPLPPTGGPTAPAWQHSGFGRRTLPRLCCPFAGRVSPSADHGTLLSSPGSRVKGSSRDPGKCCPSAFAFSSRGPSLSVCLFSSAWTGCFPWPGEPTFFFFFPLRRKDSLSRVLFSPSLLGTPHTHSPVDDPEAGEERTFPGSRFPPSRKSCVLCMSDPIALYLGDIPEFGDRQLLQGMTSKMNSEPICGGFG